MDFMDLVSGLVFDARMFRNVRKSSKADGFEPIPRSPHSLPQFTERLETVPQYKPYNLTSSVSVCDISTPIPLRDRARRQRYDVIIEGDVTDFIPRRVSIDRQIFRPPRPLWPLSSSAPNGSCLPFYSPPPPPTTTARTTPGPGHPQHTTTAPQLRNPGIHPDAHPAYNGGFPSSMRSNYVSNAYRLASPEREPE